ncbi:MAG: oligopeptide/dipeptide ABC transporter ATP-binding protein, partial [Acidimicrobiia bacterium]
VVSSVPVIFTVNAADAVLTLAGLGFLGYGGTFRIAEWGHDISVAISDVGTGFWWTSLFPGLAILLLVTGLSLLGEGINDVLNPRLRRAGLGGIAPGVRGTPEGIEAAALAVTEEPPDPADHGDETVGERLPDLAPVPLPTDLSSGNGRAGPPVLAVADLAVTYHTPRGPVRAVDGVSLEVAAGHSLGLVGESGCGKSTLGRAVLGILPRGTEHRGRVVLDGDDLTADPARWRAARGDRLALVFQDPATRLDPLMRIEDHFVEAIRAHRPAMKPAAARRLAADALAAVGVPPGRARQYPHEFSGGMRQRIMIALAVALEPRVLIADEPTTSLDVLVEAQVLRLLDSLRQRLGIAVVLVTHNLGIVAETCDRVAVMYAGRIVEEGPVAEVFARPRHPYTQGLLRSVISLDTTTLVSLPGVPPDLAHPQPGCPFAPRCPLAMATCHEVPPVAAPVGMDGHRAECHLYPGADPTHPGRAWAPAGQRRTLADPPLAGTLT